MSLGDDGDLDVGGKPQDFRDKGISGQQFEMRGTRAREKDLGDLLPVSKFHECGGWVLTMQYSRFDVEIAGKVEMLFHRISLVWRPPADGASRAARYR